MIEDEDWMRWRPMDEAEAQGYDPQIEEAEDREYEARLRRDPEFREAEERRFKEVIETLNTRHFGKN